MTATRPLRSDRATDTREAILTAAERLFAERGVFAVSNRQVSDQAGQGNNAAVGYHFGTKADLIRAIVRRHNEQVERLCEQMVDEIERADRPAELRDWVQCLVRPLAAHLTNLSGANGTSTYARFSAQLMPDPTHRDIVSEESLSSRSVLKIIQGLNRCLPDMPAEVRIERNAMARHLIVHIFAEQERARAAGDPMVRPDWDATADGLVDAITGLLLAPVTSRRVEGETP
ncbi:TetR family transcriptional regulator [Mycolicibacterium chitae]|uniref:TetR family transcriptional regulator n=1 Tax=Mycolicibacterium chitae TaxID=1792 RepID=A0A448I3R1_MYCCI|nr:TetR family transcriptional regulator [Mycolicibacterium chitae]MCV7108740.1 TetR/AcrR family transcriptional regulator [Mycolicibacterium chitae]BBZ03506.1 TetR family transcriptional regulator [Mycolicibacterium chitae]VEG47111.1 TetR family transcriptional regulator [Mycolicibacterium chitae]